MNGSATEQVGRQWRRLSLVTVALVATIVFAVGCGGDDDGGDSGASADNPTTVTVGTLPISPSAPLFLGIRKGYFTEEGLRIRTQIFQGGAEIVPAIQSGDIQIGFGNTISLFIGAARGLDITMIASGQIGPDAADEDESAVMVGRNSSIRTARDLAGKTVGVNTLANIGVLTIQAAVDEAGGDPDSIRFVEVPFPDAQNAVEGGDVDAAFFSEPFTSIATRAGFRTVTNPFYAGGAGIQIGAYFVTDRYLGDNEDVVDRFARAMARANQDAIDNPDEVRDVIPDYTRVEASAARSIRLPVYGAQLDRDRLQAAADLSQRYGLLEERLDVGGLVRD